MAAENFDELDDPLERLERNEKQGLQAFRYLLFSVAVMIAAGMAIVVLARLTGDGCADSDEACSMAGRAEFVIVPTLLGFLLSVFSMWTTYQRWRDHIRWRPWLFTTYAMWMATTACLLLTSSVALVEIG